MTKNVLIAYKKFNFKHFWQFSLVSAVTECPCCFQAKYLVKSKQVRYMLKGFGYPKMLKVVFGE